MPKSFHQLLPNYSPRDAIGTEATIIRDLLRSQGYQSEIFCGEGYKTTDARPAKELKFEIKENTSDVLFHFSVGTQFAKFWSGLLARKWLRYHNITPMQFFTRSDELHARHMCGLGRIQLRGVVEASDIILADSAYNAGEVARYSKAQPVVIPVFRDYNRLAAGAVDSNLQRHLSAGNVSTVLFVGRVSPNKCHHDLLQLLALHKKVSDRRVRVIFAGSYFSESYRKILEEFAKGLGLSMKHTWDFDADVLSLGSVSEDELTTLYRSAKLYASMSEHEGFGVPLVESMYFDLPVYAHRGTAVSEILGASEFLVDKYDWINALNVFEKALFNDEAKNREIKRCRDWRLQFGLAKASQLLIKQVEARR